MVTIKKTFFDVCESVFRDNASRAPAICPLASLRMSAAVWTVILWESPICIRLSARRNVPARDLISTPARGHLPKGQLRVPGDPWSNIRSTSPCTSTATGCPHTAVRSSAARCSPDRTFKYLTDDPTLTSSPTAFVSASGWIAMTWWPTGLRSLDEFSTHIIETVQR